MAAIGDKSKPELCFLPGWLGWKLLPKERYGDSLSGCEWNSQPSNWELDTLPLSYRRPKNHLEGNTLNSLQKMGRESRWSPTPSFWTLSLESFKLIFCSKHILTFATLCHMTGDRNVKSTPQKHWIVERFLHALTSCFPLPEPGGTTRSDGAQGKKQIWRPHVRTWGVWEANVHWRKYL